MNCNRPGCPYRKHTHTYTGGYCCNACKINGNGNHGPICQKLKANKQKKSKQKAQPASGISDISIYSWGTSKYGKYLIFNFKSATNIQPLVQLKYEILEGTTIIDKGAVPYLFNNAQIIYSSKNILNRKVSLSIIAALKK